MIRFYWPMEHCICKNFYYIKTYECIQSSIVFYWLNRKLGDETVDEQFNEQTNLTNILKWYERNVYRHLYLPLCPNETDNTIKCVRTQIWEEFLTIISWDSISYSHMLMHCNQQWNSSTIWIRWKLMSIYQHRQIFSL